MTIREYELVEIYGPAGGPPILDRVLSAAWRSWKPGDQSVVAGNNEATRDLGRAQSQLKDAFASNNPSAGFHLVSGDRRVTVAVAVAERGVAGKPIGEHFCSIRVYLNWLQATALAHDLLVALGDAISAWAGWYSPEPSAVLLESRLTRTPEGVSQQMGDEYAVLRKADLPKLKPHTFLDWPTPAIPHRIGWLNYWHATTADALGFPGTFDGTELSRGAAKTPGDAWLLKLTKEPLDLRRSEHLEAIAAAYRRLESKKGKS